MNDNQKRALGIGGIGVAGLLYMRSRRGTTRTAAPPQPTTGSVAPFTPQAPVVLQSGESVFDPNSQALLTTPSLSAPTADAPPAQPTAPAAPAYTVNVNYPPNPVTKPKRSAPAKRKPRVTRPAAKHPAPPKRHAAPKPKPKVKRKRVPR